MTSLINQMQEKIELLERINSLDSERIKQLEQEKTELIAYKQKYNLAVQKVDQLEKDKSELMYKFKEYVECIDVDKMKKFIAKWNDSILSVKV